MHLQVDRTRSKSKRLSGSRNKRYSGQSPSTSQLPSQSCPSPPPLLLKQGDSSSTHRRHYSGSSHKSKKSSRKHTISHCSTKKSKHEAANLQHDSLSGSEKEEVSITNNLQGIFLKKRESSSPKSSLSLDDGKASFVKKNSSIPEKANQFEMMPTLHNVSGNNR